MNMVVIKRDIILQEVIYSEEDLQTESFYEYANANIMKCKDENESIFQNEIYNIFALRVLAMVFFIKNNNIDCIDISEAYKDISCVVEDAANMLGIKIERGKKYREIIRCLLVDIKGILILIASFFKLALIEITVKYSDREIDIKKDFSVTRQKSGMKKIMKVYSEDSINLFDEDGIGQGSFYELYSRFYRLKQLLLSLFDVSGCIREIKQYCYVLHIKSMLCYVMEFYYRRLVHTCFFSRLLNELFDSYDWKGEYITEKNLDRFALMEEKIARNNGIKIICIPHGLEYGYILPHVFVGDKFYATSRYASLYLNKIYNTDKFVYDEEITNKMFRCNEILNSKHVIYFSEPRDSYVNINIIDGLLERLQELNIKLYIKHHPKDILSDYDKYSGKVEEISNFDMAITGNICIARKSTILLEALYNSSTAVAIITNNKDKAVFNLFPSINDNGIVKTYNIDDLVEVIKKSI